MRKMNEDELDSAIQAEKGFAEHLRTVGKDDSEALKSAERFEEEKKERYGGE